MRRRLAELPPEIFREEGRRAAEFTAGFTAWQQAERVILFLDAPGEIDTAPLLDLAFKTGKKVYLPRVEGEIARFYRIRSAEGPWQTGAFGIREPLIEGPEVPEEFPAPGVSGETAAPVLVVTPGMAFDRKGNRMGHGKGYYDRFFAKLDERKIPYKTLALCLEEQILPEVPVESWDKRMDAICTGTALSVIL